MFNRKNRDRRGGHKHSPLAGDKKMMRNYIQEPNQNIYSGNVTRAVIKNITKKKARRQHKRDTEAAMREHEADVCSVYDDLEYVFEENPFYDQHHDLDMDLGDQMDDSFYDDHHDFSPFDDLDPFGDRMYWQQRRHEEMRAARNYDHVIIREQDAGLSLGDLLRLYLNRL